MKICIFKPGVSYGRSGCHFWWMSIKDIRRWHIYFSMQVPTNIYTFLKSCQSSLTLLGRGKTSVEETAPAMLWSLQGWALPGWIHGTWWSVYDVSRLILPLFLFCWTLWLASLSKDNNNIPWRTVVIIEIMCIRLRAQLMAHGMC